MEFAYISFGALLGILLTYVKEFFDSKIYRPKIECALLGVARTKTPESNQTWTLSLAIKNQGKAEDTLNASYIVENSASDPLNYARDFSFGYFGFMHPVSIPANSFIHTNVVFQRSADNNLYHLLLRFGSGKDIKIEIEKNLVNSALAASSPTTATVVHAFNTVSNKSSNYIQPVWFK